MSKLRVVLVTDTLGYGGGERLTVDLAKGLDRSIFDVKVCVTTQGGEWLEKELIEAGIEYRILHKRLGPTLGVLPRIMALFCEWRPHLVHTFRFTANTYGRVGAILARVPVIVSTEHNKEHKSLSRQLIDITLARFTDRAIVVSKEIFDQTHTEHLLSRNRIQLIEEGIDLDRFRWVERHPVPTSTAPAVHSFKAGIVARLYPQKGHMDFLNAILRAREVHPTLKGIIVGEGQLRPELEQWVTDHQMQESIEFWGFREDLPQVFRELDLFVMSSHWEGLPIALLNAAASGLPFACTAVGGIPEVFQDGVHGRLVPPGNPDALAAAVVWSMDHYAAACAMAKTASALVHEKHGLHAMIRRHEEMYRQLVQG